MKNVLSSIIGFLAAVNVFGAKSMAKEAHQYRTLDYSLAKDLNLDLDKIKNELHINNEELLMVRYDEDNNPVNLSIFDEASFNEVRVDLHQ